MLAVLLLITAALALIVALLLVVVVAGIRQEPTATELTSRAPRPTAALTRHLLGVHVRRPDPAEGDEAHRCPHLAGHGSEGKSR
jgi:hypothetical protein